MANSKKPCKQCKRFLSVGNGIQINSGFYCNISHAILFGQKKAEEARVRHLKRAASAQKSEDTKIKKQNVAWQHKQTQKAFNRMRVLQEFLWFKSRGLEPTCISCGKVKGGDHWCCGHFKTRGAQSNLRYDTKNTFLQHNVRCNMHLSGNIEGTRTTPGYKKGLVDRFGDDDGLAIISYCESRTEPKKWTWQELEEMRKEFNKNIRNLKSNLEL